MNTTRRTALGLLAGLSLAMTSGTAFAADSAIAVSLWDKGPDSAMMDDAHQMMMSTAMMNGGMAMAMMGITLDKAEVPAGMVTFTVTNTSRDIIHEMVVSPITSLDQALPYLKDEYKIDEDAAGHLGEVAELDPGKSGSLGLEMKPGLYLLYCNIPGHYIGGMWTVLTVTE
jgi:uncharacterized cupredoxin-like copper-binding protein